MNSPKNWYQILGILLFLGGCAHPLQQNDPIVVNMTRRQTFVVPHEYFGRTTCPQLKRIFVEEEGLAILLHQNAQGQCKVIVAKAGKRMSQEMSRSFSSAKMRLKQN